MLARLLRNRNCLASVSRWLVALLVTFQAQLALASCLSPALSPAHAYEMARQTDETSPCENMPVADSAMCLGHYFQSYQATDKPGPLADALPAVEYSPEPPAFPAQAGDAGEAGLASYSFPPPRLLFCCLRN
jgi:hypothetical protein